MTHAIWLLNAIVAASLGLRLRVLWPVLLLLGCLPFQAAAEPGEGPTGAAQRAAATDASTKLAKTRSSTKPAAASVKPTRLRCEYRRDPLGVKTRKPRLGWRLAATDAEARGQHQTAYRILVASSRTKLRNDVGDLWDTGKVASEQSVQIAYAGEPLESAQPSYWKVRAWDEDGDASRWSEPATWRMGLLTPAAWDGAKWIASPTPARELKRMPLLRRAFDLTKPVKRAVVSVSGMGQFELRVNGEKATNRVMEPAWTDYRQSVAYVTYDLTEQLQPGANALGVMLGNGMYRVTGKRYAKFTGSYGPPALIAHLKITFEDGSTRTILSDENWYTHPGPITFSCIYGGEDYDARLDREGWSGPGFDKKKGWSQARVVEGPAGDLMAQVSPSIKVMKRLAPVEVTEPEPGTYVYDLGQNIAGRPAITVRGEAGQEVRLIPGETLTDKGLVDQTSMKGPWTEGTKYFGKEGIYFAYTLDGEGKETWQPRFTYTGFRYLQVKGATPDADGVDQKTPRLLEVEGRFIHAAADRSGRFESSNERYNRIHALIDAAIRANMVSTFTDCPHREKFGYPEQMHLMGPSVMFNYRVPALYQKVVRDMREAQTKSGLVPFRMPEYDVSAPKWREAPAWGSSYVICPWQMYQRYGDKRILKRHYPDMKRYVDYLSRRSRESKHEHVVMHGLGDWQDVDDNSDGHPNHTSVPLTSTAIYYQDLTILARTAALLGKKKDAARYGDLAETVWVAFNERFFDADASTYGSGSQTANSMPLALGITPPDQTDAVLKNIVKDIREHGDHLTTGEVGHPYMLKGLRAAGRSDVIADMTSQTDAPGYGIHLKKGKTTLTESWDAEPGLSQNHFMLGHIEQWFYQGLGGIRPDREAPGFKQFIIKPQPVDAVKWVKVRYDSIHGRIASHWKRTGERFTLEVTVPPNTTATVHVPAAKGQTVTESESPAGEAPGVTRLRRVADRAIYRVKPGDYRFVREASE